MESVQVLGALFQVVVLPLLMWFWRQQKEMMRDLQASMVTRELCERTHAPLNRLFSNGLAEQITQLRERVAALEEKTKHSI